MKSNVSADIAGRVARELVGRLSPACDRIAIAGSLRRRRAWVGDIEILCIPRYKGFIDMMDREVKHLIQAGVMDYRANRVGRRVYGRRNKLLVHVRGGIGVDIFSTTEECWPVALVVRTGGEKTNKRIAAAALRKGWRFHAYGSGFSTPRGELVCRSEREVFEAVGLPYQEPWERE